MKPYLTAACVKLSKVIAADPVGTLTTMGHMTVIAAPYVIGVGLVAGAGYGIYKLITK